MQAHNPARQTTRDYFLLHPFRIACSVCVCKKDFWKSGRSARSDFVCFERFVFRTMAIGGREVGSMMMMMMIRSGIPPTDRLDPGAFLTWFMYPDNSIRIRAHTATPQIATSRATAKVLIGSKPEAGEAFGYFSGRSLQPHRALFFGPSVYTPPRRFVWRRFGSDEDTFLRDASLSFPTTRKRTTQLGPGTNEWNPWVSAGSERVIFFSTLWGVRPYCNSNTNAKCYF